MGSFTNLLTTPIMAEDFWWWYIPIMSLVVGYWTCVSFWMFSTAQKFWIIFWTRGTGELRLAVCIAFSQRGCCGTLKTP
jgi:hypothetical protein